MTLALVRLFVKVKFVISRPFFNISSSILPTQISYDILSLP